MPLLFTGHTLNSQLHLCSQVRTGTQEKGNSYQQTILVGGPKGTREEDCQLANMGVNNADLLCNHSIKIEFFILLLLKLRNNNAGGSLPFLFSKSAYSNSLILYYSIDDRVILEQWVIRLGYLFQWFRSNLHLWPLTALLVC